MITIKKMYLKQIGKLRIIRRKLMATMDKENMKDVNESDANRTLDVTKRYNFNETYQSFTNYAGFSALPQKLKELGLEAKDQNLYPELANITSKDDIIKIAIEMLGKIDPRLKTMAQNVMTNPSIEKQDIRLSPANTPYSSTGRIAKDTDGRIRLDVQCNRDVTGVVAVAQNLIEAGLYYEYFKHQDNTSEKRSDFARDTAKKFIGYAMIDVMANTPYMNISSIQKEQLINEHMQEDFSNIQAMEEDCKLFEAFLEANQDKVQDFEDMDKDTMNNLFADFIENNYDPQLQEALDNRIKDIADEGKTSSFIVGDALKGIVALQTIENIKATPEADPIKKLMQGAINGLNVQEITGKTPEQLANNSPELVQKMAEGEMSAVPQNENDREQEIVMEMIKQQNANINNPY